MSIFETLKNYEGPICLAEDKSDKSQRMLDLALALGYDLPAKRFSSINMDAIERFIQDKCRKQGCYEFSERNGELGVWAKAGSCLVCGKILEPRDCLQIYIGFENKILFCPRCKTSEIEWS